MVKTTGFLPNSLSCDVASDEYISLADEWLTYLRSLGVAINHVKRHPNRLKYLELNGKVIAAVSEWNEDDEGQYWTSRLDIDTAFALEHRTAFTESRFRQYASERIREARGWAKEYGLSSKDLKHVVRSAMRTFDRFFCPE